MTIKSSTWEKTKYELYPLSLWPSPWFLGPLWLPPASLRNPCMHCCRPNCAGTATTLRTGAVILILAHSILAVSQQQAMGVVLMAWGEGKQVGKQLVWETQMSGLATWLNLTKILIRLDSKVWDHYRNGVTILAYGKLEPNDGMDTCCLNAWLTYMTCKLFVNLIVSNCYMTYWLELVNLWSASALYMLEVLFIKSDY